MLEDILEPSDKDFEYAGKTYKIKPMNIIQTDKVFKLLPTSEFLGNSKETLIKLVMQDLDKLIAISIEASKIDKNVIYTMQPHHMVDLISTIYEVNKPSFFLAWKKIQEAMKVESTGSEQSKPL